MRVFKSHFITFLQFFAFMEPIILAARFTMSPSTENSFLEPCAPVTPEKHSPEETPILQYTLSFMRALMILKPVSRARYASSSCAKGSSPQIQIMVLPLSSITNLLIDP